MRESIGLVSSAPMMATGTTGVRVRRPELDEPAAPEALELVAILEELPDTLHALGEDGDERSMTEQSLGVLLAGAHGADAVGEAAEEREVEDEVLGQPAHLATSRVLALARPSEASSPSKGSVPEWFATRRQRPSCGNVLDAVHLDAEVLVVEEVEERQDLLLVDRVEAELVDLLGAVAQANATPFAEVEVGRQELARRVEHAVGGRAGWSTGGRGGSDRGVSAGGVLLRGALLGVRRQSSDRAALRARGCGRRRRGSLGDWPGCGGTGSVARDARAVSRAGRARSRRVPWPARRVPSASSSARTASRSDGGGRGSGGGGTGSAFGDGAFFFFARHAVLSVRSFTSRRRCALTKSSSASRDVYAGREAQHLPRQLPVGHAEEAQVLEEGRRAPRRFARPSRRRSTVFAKGWGTGTATRPASLMTVDSGRTPSPTMLNVPGTSRSEGQVKRRDRVHLVEELNERVEPHHRRARACARGNA